MLVIRDVQALYDHTNDCESALAILFVKLKITAKTPSAFLSLPFAPAKSSPVWRRHETSPWIPVKPTVFVKPCALNPVKPKT